MYSPKIKEEFIPVLYRLAKEQKVSMTRLVNDLVASGIKRLERRKSYEQSTCDRLRRSSQCSNPEMLSGR